MKRMTHYGKRDNLLHIETPLGIVNIRVGLTDEQGNRVERIDYLPNWYAGEPLIALDGDVGSIRAVEQKEAQ